eukprot:TRINITY_DN1568_c0_g2_i2.p1 TRINITY_DN1568_c0_g2~~TRINITY_DN1568_c0_g2_i2.p1  ORF type:complete len:1119 (+),score=333.19 TRINITY_DN1568_c0_g2_i2:22-3357(+)
MEATPSITLTEERPKKSQNNQPRKPRNDHKMEDGSDHSTNESNSSQRPAPHNRRPPRRPKEDSTTSSGDQLPEGQPPPNPKKPRNPRPPRPKKNVDTNTPNHESAPIQSSEGNPTPQSEQTQKRNPRRRPNRAKNENEQSSENPSSDRSQPPSEDNSKPRPPRAPRNPRPPKQNRDDESGATNQQQHKPQRPPRQPRRNEESASNGEGHVSQPNERANRRPPRQRDNRQNNEKASDQTSFPRGQKNTKPPGTKPGDAHHAHKQRDDKKPRRKDRYLAFLTPEEATEGLKNRTLFQGKIRINARNRQDAYVTVDGLERDIYIDGSTNRNRALEGDTVVVRLEPVAKWKILNTSAALEAMLDDPDKSGVIAPLDQENGKEEISENSKIQVEDKLKDEIEVQQIEKQMQNLSVQVEDGVVKLPKINADGKFIQPTGIVVYISQHFLKSEIVGTLKTQHDSGKIQPEDRFAMFIPQDVKLPKLLIPIAQIPGFYKDPTQYENKLVMARMYTWNSDSYLPKGRFEAVVGEAGEIKAETEALLRCNNVDSRDFSEKILNSLPSGQYIIPDDVIKSRRDLRSTRIFTIDPPTAKDLDDALHITPLSNGCYEVGVHIADVSNFVLPDTELDTEAAARATTVYLVQKAVPMLPHVLCENLCSLNPGVDRLAFSVIWTVNPKGEIQNEWFGRTVIKSVSKMSYNVAQEIIEGKIKEKWEDTTTDFKLKDLGPIPGTEIRDIVKDVLGMHAIAQNLRNKRFEGGSVTLNNVKLGFQLDEFGNPWETHQYITREANHMIEEFMLLANMRVALKIATTFPDHAMLRLHPEPSSQKFEPFVQFCNKIGIQLDTSNSKKLAESLELLKSKFSKLEFQALQMLGTRPMQLAKYFCTGEVSPDKWRHYALNVDHYTHFTSPIRRYPDIVVHRQLQKSIDIDGCHGNVTTIAEILKSLTPSHELGVIAEHCNEKKLSSRKAQEASQNLYLCLMLKNRPLALDAVCLNLGENFATIVVPYLSEEKRIYYQDLCLVSHKYDAKTNTAVLEWPAIDGQIGTVPTVMQTVHVLGPCRVTVFTKPNKFPMEVAAKFNHPSDPITGQDLKVGDVEGGQAKEVKITQWIDPPEEDM